MTKKIVYELKKDIERAALMEEDKVEAFFIKKPQKINKGDIFVGKVADIHDGLQGAFVDIGFSKRGFLHKEELLSYHQLNSASYKKENKPISRYLEKGDKVIVQVKKEPMKKKGALLTQLPSLLNTYSIYLPLSGYVAVSKRIPDEMRDKLRDALIPHCQENEGVILRTAAQEVSLERILLELQQARKLWHTLLQNAEATNQWKKLYEESPKLIDQLVMDYAHESIDEWLVNDYLTYQRLSSKLEQSNVNGLVQYVQTEELFQKLGIEDDYKSASKTKVPLAHGGYLYIEYTEALTVIDINTGRFTGCDSWEETARLTNREAVLEIARQLRLRQIGGIIIIDLIKMASEEDAKEILRLFETALQKDKGTINGLALTGLGLIELTRKASKHSLYNSLK